MTKNKTKFQIFQIKILSVFVHLTLMHKGKARAFSFIFHTREKRDEFVLRYPENQFPIDNSIEIEICDTPFGLMEKDPDSVHIATDKSWSRLERYICHYPGKNHEEALEISKFWARFNVRLAETGNTSTKKDDVMAFKLDEEIQIYEIR